LSIDDKTIDSLLESLLELHPKRFNDKIVLGLERTLSLLNKLENPQDKLSEIIHVAGTSGKFSTINFIRAILQFNKKKLNIYLSPHIQRFNERYTINNKIIENKDLYEALNHVRRINDNDEISFFEITSSTFYYLAQKHPADYNIVETGLGGMLDSTNVHIPSISCITSISYDHMEYLGNSIEEIATQKAGIIKKHIPVVISYQPYQEALETLLEYSSLIEAPTFVFNRDFFISRKKNELVYEDCDNLFTFKSFENIPELQEKNLATAIFLCLQLYNIEVKSFLTKNKHQDLVFPGRFHKITEGKLLQYINKKQELIVDGCHSENESFNVNKSINKLPQKDLCLIFGMLRTKDPKKFISQFENVSAIKTIEIPDEENSYTAEELKNEIRSEHDNIETSNNIIEALQEISKEYPTSRVVCVGSLYLAGKILNIN
tara:strand:+ start:358 stop:1656 length:1299 start_codon:yes stop_codon:yes gene_type:complete